MSWLDAIRNGSSGLFSSPVQQAPVSGGLFGGAFQKQVPGAAQGNFEQMAAPYAAWAAQQLQNSQNAYNAANPDAMIPMGQQQQQPQTAFDMDGFIRQMREREALMERANAGSFNNY